MCFNIKLNENMAPPRVDVRLERLIVRLRDDEHLTMEAIGQQLKMGRSTISKVYRRAKNPRAVSKGGRPRKTDERCG